jgi:hypothetical protein
MSKSSHLTAIPPGYAETRPGVLTRTSPGVQQVTIGPQPPQGYAGQQLERIADEAKRAPTASEKALQRACESRLRGMGVTYLHLSYRAREACGWPDLVFAVNGTPYAVELKRPGLWPTDAQCAMLDAMAHNGWLVGVAWKIEDMDTLISTMTGPARERWYVAYAKWQDRLASKSPHAT